MRKFFIMAALSLLPLASLAQAEDDLMEDCPFTLPLENGKYSFSIPDSADIEKKLDIAKFTLKLVDKSEESNIYVDKYSKTVYLHFEGKLKEKYYKCSGGAITRFNEYNTFDVEVKCLRGKFEVTISRPYNFLTFWVQERGLSGGKRVFIATDQDLSAYAKMDHPFFYADLNRKNPFPFDRQLYLLKADLYFAYKRIFNYMNESSYNNFQMLGF